MPGMTRFAIFLSNDMEKRWAIKLNKLSLKRKNWMGKMCLHVHGQ